MFRGKISFREHFNESEISKVRSQQNLFCAGKIQATDNYRYRKQCSFIPDDYIQRNQNRQLLRKGPRTSFGSVNLLDPTVVSSLSHSVFHWSAHKRSKTWWIHLANRDCLLSVCNAAWLAFFSWTGREWGHHAHGQSLLVCWCDPSHETKDSVWVYKHAPGFCMNNSYLGHSAWAFMLHEPCPIR